MLDSHAARLFEGEAMTSRVGIIMGSASDKDVMKEAANVLDEFGIPWEMRIGSAHRTPDIVHEWASTARSRGVDVIICGAGMAAHLAGVVAAFTSIPVLGVPLGGSSSGIAGLDALLSTVQMPGGVPVATFAVGKAGAKNAAHFAARILAVKDEAVAERVEQFRRSMAVTVENADKELQRELGRGDES